MKKQPRTGKKVTVFYFEEPETKEYMDNLPYHTKSQWIRTATKALMLKELKK